MSRYFMFTQQQVTKRSIKVSFLGDLQVNDDKQVRGTSVSAIKSHQIHHVRKQKQSNVIPWTWSHYRGLRCLYHRARDLFLYYFLPFFFSFFSWQLNYHPLTRSFSFLHLFTIINPFTFFLLPLLWVIHSLPLSLLPSLLHLFLLSLLPGLGLNLLTYT